MFLYQNLSDVEINKLLYTLTTCVGSDKHGINTFIDLFATAYSVS